MGKYRKWYSHFFVGSFSWVDSRTSKLLIHLKFIDVFINILKLILIGTSDFVVDVSTQHLRKEFHTHIRVKKVLLLRPTVKTISAY